MHSTLLSLRKSLAETLPFPNSFPRRTNRFRFSNRMVSATAIIHVAWIIFMCYPILCVCLPTPSSVVSGLLFPSSSVPHVDASVATGRAGGAFHAHTMNTYATTTLTSTSLPASTSTLTMNFYIRSLIPNRFAQICLLEVPPDQTANLAPFSIYTYTDWTVIVNGQLVSESLSTYLALDGNWHYVSVTWDATSGLMQFFLDGVKTSDHTGVAPNQTLPLRGAQLSLAKQRWNDQLLGQIDEFSMFASVLSASDMVTLQAGALGPALQPSLPLHSTFAALLARTSPVAIYNFDAVGNPSLTGAAGDALLDSSGLAHDLVVSFLSSEPTIHEIVPSTAPCWTTNEKWILLPSGSDAKAVRVTLAGSDASDVVITSLPNAAICTLNAVGAAAVVGPAVNTNDHIVLQSGTFDVYVTCTGVLVAEQTYLTYTTSPAASNAVTAPFSTKLVLTPNHAPLPWPHTEVSIDQRRQSVVQLISRIYPSDHNYMSGDLDGERPTVWIVNASQPFHGVLYQLQADGATLGSLIDTTTISISNPLQVSNENGFVVYTAPSDSWGTGLDVLTFDSSDQFSVSSSISVKAITVNRLPVAPVISPLSVSVEEGNGILITLPVISASSTAEDYPYVTITKLPTKGRMFQVLEDGSKGEEILLSGGFSGVTSQWVSNVTGWSSYYEDSSGAWSQYQILGAPNAWPIYGDSVNAWASAETDSPEWLELEFPEDVFITRIESFENYNPRHLQRVLARNERHQWQLLWEGTPDPAEPSPPDARAYVNMPTLCPVSFSSRNVRFEIASTGASWAELDAVRLTGTKELPRNVVQDSLSRVWYEADPLQNGTDSFSYSALDCEWYVLYRELGLSSKDVTINIGYHNHVPIPTANVSWTTNSNGQIMSFTLEGVDLDVGDLLTISVEQLPQFGDLFADGRQIAATDLPIRLPIGTTFDFKASSFCLYDEQPFVSDSVVYKLGDGQSWSTGHQLRLNVMCAKPQTTSTGMSGTIIFLCALGLASVCAIGLILAYCRRSPVVKASTLMFNLLALVGCAGVYLSMLTFISPANDGWCLTRWWLPCCSVTLLLAAVFAKTHRIKKIFSQQKLQVASHVRDHHVLLIVSGLMSVTILLLILYSALATPKLYYDPSDVLPAQRRMDSVSGNLDPSSHLAFGSCSTHNVFRGLLFGYIGALLLWGTYLAIGIRSVPAAFNEASYLGMTVYSILFCAIVGLPLDLAINSNPAAQQLLRCFLFFLGNTVCVSVLFGSKLVMLWTQRDLPAAVYTAAATTGGHDKSPHHTVMVSEVGGGPRVGSIVHSKIAPSKQHLGTTAANANGGTETTSKHRVTISSPLTGARLLIAPVLEQDAITQPASIQHSQPGSTSTAEINPGNGHATANSSEGTIVLPNTVPTEEA